MKVFIRPSTSSDLPAVRRLLETEGLPVDILEHQKWKLWVAEESGLVVGSGALEVYGEDALLRSVAIDKRLKGQGLGKKMVEFLEKEALRRGVRTLWLLTETAAWFFPRLGYDTVPRSVIVNKGILDSSEFKHLCSSTAVCMTKGLGRARMENRKS